jgi:hypothetical protein
VQGNRQQNGETRGEKPDGPAAPGQPDSSGRRRPAATPPPQPGRQKGGGRSHRRRRRQRRSSEPGSYSESSDPAAAATRPAVGEDAERRRGRRLRRLHPRPVAEDRAGRSGVVGVASGEGRLRLRRTKGAKVGRFDGSQVGNASLFYIKKFPDKIHLFLLRLLTWVYLRDDLQ